MILVCYIFQDHYDFGMFYFQDHYDFGMLYLQDHYDFVMLYFRIIMTLVCYISGSL